MIYEADAHVGGVWSTTAHLQGAQGISRPKRRSQSCGCFHAFTLLRSDLATLSVCRVPVARGPERAKPRLYHPSCSRSAAVHRGKSSHSGSLSRVGLSLSSFRVATCHIWLYNSCECRRNMQRQDSNSSRGTPEHGVTACIVASETSLAIPTCRATATPHNIIGYQQTNSG